MKAKFLIPILVGWLSMIPKLSAAYPDTVLADNPLGYWRLGEADTNSGAINIGSLGAEATGTFDNEPTPGVEGIVAGDTAVYFDGSDDKIEVPFVPELNPSGPFTVEIWAKAVIGSTHRAPMASRDDTPVGTSAGYILYLNPNNNWQFWVGTGGAWASITGPSLSEDDWTHLVGQYDGSCLYFIVNGVQFGSLHVPNYRVNTERPFRLGASANEGPGNFFWEGELDEAAFYGALLPHTRILTHYSEIKGEPEQLAPEIVTQPLSPAGVTYVGGSVRVGTSVSGSLPLTYQWKRNGTVVEGQTSPVLILDNTQETDSGIYTLTVTNSLGEIETDPVELAIIPTQLPVIEAQPTPLKAFIGAPASFSVQASGAVTFTYQWQKNNVDLPGETAAELHIAAVTAESFGTYRVIVTSTAGSTTSDAVELSPISPPTDSYGSVIASDGPIAWWRLDDNFVEGEGEAADYLGANPGFYAEESAPEFGVSGIPGRTDGTAAYFESGLSQKIDVPFSPTLNRTTFTLECWARVTGGSSYRSPITSRDDGPQRGFIIYAGDNETWQFWTGTGSGWNSIAGPALEYDEWAHLVCVVDGEDKLFYVNGTLAGSTTAPFALNTARPLRIGGGATEGNGAFFFNGDIDEVALYGHALSEDRIAAHYEAGLSAGPGAPPVLTIIPAGNNRVTITWTSGTLETSTSLQPNWTPQPNAVSPLTEDVTGAKFYRVRY